MKKVGIFVGRERSFPDALIAAIAKRDAGVEASYGLVNATSIAEPPPYDVIVDRISHEVTGYQTLFKLAVLNGTRMVNDPFWRIADDKFFNTALASKLGVAVPKTYALPSKAYGSDITAASLSNLGFPVPWESIVAELGGFPLFMKPHWGGGWRDVYRLTSMEELFRAYDKTGQLTMILQQGIRWEQYVRCIVVGKENVRPALWNPSLGHFDRYKRASESMPALSPELEARVISDAKKICHALGYDMNTVEFAIQDGVPYAIDFMNSAPDFDITSLGDEHFAWVVEQMAELCIRLAKEPVRAPRRWDEALGAK